MNPLNEYFSEQLSELQHPDLEHLNSYLNEFLDSFKSSFSNNLIAISDKRKRFKKASLKPEDPAAEKSKHDKQTREELFKEHQKKVEETKEFTKKLITERLLRERRQHEKESQNRAKVLQETEEQLKRQEEIQQKLEEDKQRRLAGLVQKSELRKKQMEEIKEQIITRKPSQKPLYKQMEDNFKQQVIMPNLEQQKSELAKKRILYQPLSLDDIKEHARRHEELRREQEYKRKKDLEQRNLENQVNSVSNNLYSKFTSAVLEEERLKREEKLKLEIEKKANLQKRDQYSKLVKEMFPPIINENKKFDPEDKRRSQKALKSAQSGEHFREASVGAAKIGPADYKSDLNLGKIPKRVYKENNMVKKPEAKKEAKVVDYLLERRKVSKNEEPVDVDIQREVYEEDIDEEKAKKIKAKAEKLEKMALKQERIIGIGKSSSFKNIQAEDQVNDMIISSIKTKLALLDKFSIKS